MTEAEGPKSEINETPAAVRAHWDLRFMPNVSFDWSVGLLILIAAFVFGVWSSAVLRSCNSRPPAVQPLTVGQMRALVQSEAWAKGTHGPILRVREPGATCYRDLELAGDWVAGLGKQPPLLRWIVPVTVGPEDLRQIPGMFCLCDDATALRYMQSWIERNPKPAEAKP